MSKMPPEPSCPFHLSSRWFLASHHQGTEQLSTCYMCGRRSGKTITLHYVKNVGLVVRVPLPPRGTVVEDSMDSRKSQTVFCKSSLLGTERFKSLKKNIDLPIFYEYVFFACMSVHHVCTMFMEVRNQCQMFWNWSYRCLWATMYLLGLSSGPLQEQ